MNILTKPLISKLKADIIQYSDLESYEEYLLKEKTQLTILCAISIIITSIFIVSMLMIDLDKSKDGIGITLSFMFWVGFFVKNIIETFITLKSSSIKSEVWSFYQSQVNKKSIAGNAELLLKEYLTEPKNFCKAYFGKNGSSFMSFFQDRAFIGKELNPDFIFYALSLPRVKELSIDSLRKILLAYQPLNLREPLDLSMCFKAYTLRDIERLFTSPFNRVYLFSLPQEELVVEKDLVCLEDKYQEKAIPEKFKVLHNKVVSSLHFKMLLSKRDYELAGRVFSNCLKDYRDNSVVVFSIYLGASPVGCFSIKEKGVQEIKGPANQVCLERERILAILMDKGLINA